MSEQEKSRSCTLKVRHGLCEDVPVTFRRLNSNAVAVFVEPEPTFGRIAGFNGLWLGPASDVAWRHPINEARFFFADGWVHIVDNQWAAFHESDKDPAWVKSLSSEKPIESWDVVAVHKSIILIRDLNRYGLSKNHSGYENRSVNVIEYTLNGRLVGWRMEPK